MVKVVCHSKEPLANGLAHQQELVVGGVDARGEHPAVGLVLVDALQLGLQEPRRGVEPLEDDEQVAEQYVNRVAGGNVGALMGKDVFGMVGIVFLADDDGAHPAERRHVATDDDRAHPAGIGHHAPATQQAAQRQERPHLAHEEERHTYNIYGEARRGRSQHTALRLVGHDFGHGILYDDEAGNGCGAAFGRDVHQGQQQRERGHGEQNAPVEAEERLAAEQQLVNQVERRKAQRYFYRVYEEQCHSQMVFTWWQTSFVSSLLFVLADALYQLTEFVNGYFLVLDEGRHHVEV